MSSPSTSSSVSSPTHPNTQRSNLNIFEDIDATNGDEILGEASADESVLREQENKPPALPKTSRTLCRMKAFCGTESFKYKSELDPEVSDGRVEFTFTPRELAPITIEFKVHCIGESGFVTKRLDESSVTDESRPGLINKSEPIPPTEPSKTNEGEKHPQATCKRPRSAESDTPRKREKS